MLSCELRDKWVEALRSGKYAQGQHTMRRGNNYCCLAVLCEVGGVESRRTTVGSDYEYHVPARGFVPVGRGDWTHGTPKEVLGLDEDWCVRLAEKNDSGTTFADIADLVEREVPCAPSVEEK